MDWMGMRRMGLWHDFPFLGSTSLNCGFFDFFGVGALSGFLHCVAMADAASDGSVTLMP